MLKIEQVAILGRFRQAFQQLRQSIQSGHHLEWFNSENPEYRSFKELAVKVAGMLAADWPDKVPEPDRAAGQLLPVTSNEWEKS